MWAQPLEQSRADPTHPEQRLEAVEGSVALTRPNDTPRQHRSDARKRLELFGGRAVEVDPLIAAIRPTRDASPDGDGAQRKVFPDALDRGGADASDTREVGERPEGPVTLAAVHHSSRERGAHARQAVELDRLGTVRIQSLTPGERRAPPVLLVR